MIPWAAGLCAAAALLAGTGPARSGEMTRERLAAIFPAPLVVGERDARLPVWPIFEPGADAKPALHAQVFESIDLEPVPGYAAKPINVLVTLDPAGTLLEARLLSHQEPLFRTERGTAVLAAFAAQYGGLTPRHQVQVLSPKAQRSQTADTATLHGVLAGTVTTTAIDRSILESAMQVVQARLADPNARVETSAAGRGPDDRYQRMSFSQLADARLLQPVAVSNAQLGARFKGTPVAGHDSEGRLQPAGSAIDAWIAPVALPQAGRNLLDRAGWAEVRVLREAGTPTLLVLDGGRYRIEGSDAETAAGPARSARLSLRQGERSVALRELPYPHGLQLGGQRSGVAQGAVPRLFAAEQGGLDLLQPMSVVLRVERRETGDGAGGGAGGRAAPIATEFVQPFEIPEAAAYAPVAEAPAWHKAWAAQRDNLLVLGAGLAVLTLMLWRQRWLAARRLRLAGWRLAYLVFTLVFIGWVGQAQLSIVNLTALIESVIAGTGAVFLLFDPMTVALWAFVVLSLLVWGRGTFCGWLCPFGALQELISVVTQRLGIRPRHLRVRLDARLKRIKYALLAAIVGAAFTAPAWAERLIEAEPFKTAISLHYQREWPYVAWAVACLALSVFVYRGYCRYICPLGAALALLGRVRLLDWIPRRAQCGTPCQSCRHRCGYQSIAPSGKVDYAECFQCLECVSIHDDAQRCLPLIVQRKALLRVIPLAVAPVSP